MGVGVATTVPDGRGSVSAKFQAEKPKKSKQTYDPASTLPGTQLPIYDLFFIAQAISLYFQSAPTPGDEIAKKIKKTYKACESSKENDPYDRCHYDSGGERCEYYFDEYSLWIIDELIAIPAAEIAYNFLCDFALYITELIKYMECGECTAAEEKGDERRKPISAHLSLTLQAQEMLKSSNFLTIPWHSFAQIQGLQQYSLHRIISLNDVFDALIPMRHRHLKGAP